MKSLLCILFISAVSLAHGQSTEIGLRDGLSYNFTNGQHFSNNPNYYSSVPSLYIHFKSRKRINYELEAGFWQRERSEDFYSDWSEGTLGYQHLTEVATDKYVDLTLTTFYNLHKTQPFEERKTHHFVGLTVGALLNFGQTNITRSISDTDLVLQETYGTGNAFVPLVGLAYLMNYSLTRHIALSGLLTYKILFPGDNVTFYGIDKIPLPFTLSLKLGIAYKFNPVSRETRIN